MECRYCQASNAEDDHRCRRCGRRLRRSPAYTGSSAAAPVLQYETATVLQYETAPVLQRETAPVLQRETAPVLHEAHVAREAGAPRRTVSYQPSLFPSRELPLVVRFETLIQPSPRKPQPQTPRQRRRKMIPGQQALEFNRQAARSSKAADGVIYCDAPVAIPAHRALAAALDGSIMLIALAIFGLIFRLAGGSFVLNAKTAPMFVGVAAGIVIFYRLLWCLANGDTAGQKWTRLRLVNFDGHAPTCAQRLSRTASGLLSVLAGGIGLLWGLVDEETLTWHDHISKTFLTPVV
jgi:uncharacterized RDD family membrane protein YckC